MSDHKVLWEAEFNPNVKKYWLLAPVILFTCLIVTIPVAILYYIIASFFVDRYLANMSCTLTERTLDIKKGIWNRTESTIPLEKITDLQMFQGPIMRYFDLHGFKVETAGQSGGTGGALVNTRGQLVGVNTAIYSRSGGSNGIGFAIPAEMVKRVVNAAMNEGTFVRPWLGLAAQSVSFDMAKAQGLSRPVGVMVTEVYDDGPADKAGLRRGDLITAIDGREVFDEKGLKFLAAIRNPGETAQLNVLRGGKNQVVSVKVEPPPGATEADIVLLRGQNIFDGARVVELSPRLAEENGLDPFQKGSGIYVYSVARRSIARTYFRPGDIIRSVNGKQTKTIKDLQDVLAKSGRAWDVEIERNGRTIRGTIRL